MSKLGDLLLRDTDELVNRWYRRWLLEGPAVAGPSEAVIKDHLDVQLRAIAHALRDGRSSEPARDLWQDPARSDPEQRVRDDVPIEEVVREYGFVLDELRNWLAEQPDEFPFEEVSFLFLAFFELAAESARRYTKFATAAVKRTRSEYVAGIAHQLRTPLSTLRLGIQKIERSHGVVAPADLERLRRTIKRLERLVEGIARVERFGPDEMPVSPVEVRPAEVIDALLADYEHDAIRKGLRLEVIINRSARMVTDPDLLIDALGNLIQNAIKYTERGFVRISVEEHPEELVFRVEDSGPGITKDRQQELFRPVRSGTAGGMGLGLSIADRAARSQGGAIELRSKVGEGSTFLLRLPKEARARTDELRPSDV